MGGKPAGCFKHTRDTRALTTMCEGSSDERILMTRTVCRTSVLLESLQSDNRFKEGERGRERERERERERKKKKKKKKKKNNNNNITSKIIKQTTKNQHQ